MNKNRVIGLLVVLNVLAIALMAVKYPSSGSGMQGSPTTAPAVAAPYPARSTAASRRTEIVTAAEKVSPAIVSVGASQTTLMLSPFADFFSDYAVYPYQQKIPYLGSGVIIDARNGLIVTNWHVVQDASDVFVTLMDGREVPAKLVDADTYVDVALLQIQAQNLSAVRLGDSSDLMVGEWVLAMGNPFGNLIGDPHPTVTVGVVSAVKRSFRPNSEVNRVYQDMIQTDAAINPGNSGGALINVNGDLIGMNTFIMSRSGGAEGIGFAIPVNRIKSVVEEILMHGHIRSRYRDFDVQNLKERIAKQLRSKATQGAVISEIEPGGPAERAGLRVGDVITQVDGRPVKDREDFLLYVWTQPVGTTVKCTVDRGGKTLQIAYTLTEPPQQQRSRQVR